ncbi:hypothetical protein AAVH_26600 [Aphelenchoides avenae]|nr:hypothetical protein AAVH_26600 [Aphelenchus avenae]
MQRPVRDVPVGEPFSVNFHHVPKELLERCPSFADIAFARLAGEGLAASAKDLKGVEVRRLDGEVVSQPCWEQK